MTSGECHAFGAQFPTRNPIPASRPGLLNAGPSGLKAKVFESTQQIRLMCRTTSGECHVRIYPGICLNSATPNESPPLSLVTRHSSLVTRHSSLVTRHSSLVNHPVLFTPFPQEPHLDEVQRIDIRIAKSDGLLQDRVILEQLLVFDYLENLLAAELVLLADLSEQP